MTLSRKLTTQACVHKLRNFSKIEFNWEQSIILYSLNSHGSQQKALLRQSKHYQNFTAVLIKLSHRQLIQNETFSISLKPRNYFLKYSSRRWKYWNYTFINNSLIINSYICIGNVSYILYSYNAFQPIRSMF